MRTQEPQHDGDMNPIVSDDMESQRNPLKRHITGEEPITPNASTGTYTWQFFDGSTRPCERALEPALPGARNLCCVMGLLGVRIIRVTDKQSEIDGGVQFSHFLSTDVPRRGVWRTVSNAFLMICLLPVSISLTVTALPLHELKEPIGSDGLLPLSEYWGWIFQVSYKAIASMTRDEYLIFYSSFVFADGAKQLFCVLHLFWYVRRAIISLSYFAL